MNSDKVNQWLSQNMNNFNPAQIQDIKTRLESIPEEKWMTVMSVEFRDCTTMLILSLLIGELGVDRFMLGDTGMGILKLLTGGCCGILWLIDVINIKKMTRDYNYKKFIEAISII